VGAAPELVKPGVNGATFPAGELASLAAALREVTSVAAVDEAKRQSRRVLHGWLAECDPVAAFRAALEDSGVIALTSIDSFVAREPHSIRTAGDAVVPV
jgi:hypothetical protein